MKQNSRTTEAPSRRRTQAEESLGFAAEFGEDRTDRGHVPDHSDTFFDHDGIDPADEFHPEEEARAGEEAGQSPDDTLGLYLRQMGAIPLLTRQEELDLSKRLETARRRYRHAGLLSWRVLSGVVDVFERVMSGQLAVDPTIDVVTSLNLSREKILARMPHNVRTLRFVLREA
jgi:RNA polymerase primary sigma factor